MASKPTTRADINKRHVSNSSPVISNKPLQSAVTSGTPARSDNQAATCITTDMPTLIINALKNPEVALSIGNIIGPFISQQLNHEISTVKLLLEENASLKARVKELTEINAALANGIHSPLRKENKSLLMRNLSLPSSYNLKAGMISTMDPIRLDCTSAQETLPKTSYVSATNAAGMVTRAESQFSSVNEPGNWNLVAHKKPNKIKKIVGKGALSEKNKVS